jgi:hypothetical protein
MQPLASWIEDFFARITFMQDWLLNGPRPSYWLSGFFFPQVPYCSVIPHIPTYQLLMPRKLISARRVIDQ